MKQSIFNTSCTNCNQFALKACQCLFHLLFIFLNSLIH